ncbi:MAG: sigma-70 family RNA polymerase sigma factor [Planctomycetota bacterium]
MSSPHTDFCRFRQSGDPAALARVFDAVAPELLMVAVHVAHDEERAEDLLQETFLAAIEGASAFDPEQRLVPWLVGILVNQARRQRRDRQRQPELERLAPRQEAGPREAAEAQEFAEAIAAAMRDLPQPYRQVVTLSMVHGLSPKAIAHALERPAGTVKAQLHRGREILRRALPTGFAAAAVGWLTAGPGLAAVRARVLDRAGILRRARRVAVWRTSAIGSAVVLGLALTGWWAVHTAHPVEPTAPVTKPAPPTAPAPAAVAPTAPTPSRTATATAPLAEGPASLHIQALWHDGDPAPGVMVSLLPTRLANAWLHQRWLPADERGRVEVQEWPAGPLLVEGDRGGELRAEIRANRTYELELRIPRGIAVIGTLVDANGAPLGDAQITVSRRERYDDHVAIGTADANGAFRLRDIEPDRCLSAITGGHRCAAVVQVTGAPGATAQIALRSPAAAGVLAGTVTDREGAPVAGARLMVGDRLGSPRPGGVPPEQLVTDAAGRFRCDSAQIVPDPEAHLWVRAPGLAPWTGRVPVGGDPVCVVLDPAARVDGQVTDDAGQPVDGVRLELQDGINHRTAAGLHPPAWGRVVAWSDANGRFSLRGAAAVDQHAAARGDDGRCTSELIAIQAGTTGAANRWNPVLREPARLAGTVHDDQGTPLPGWQVRLQAPRPFTPLDPVVTDAAGRFEILDVESCRYALRCRMAASPWPGAQHGQRDVRREQSPLQIVVPRRVLPSCRLRGTIVDRDGDGRPLHVGVYGAGFQRWLAPVDAAGAFDIGPVPPGEHVIYVFGGSRSVAYRGPRWLEADETWDLGTIDVQPHGVLRVRVVNEAGRPVDGARVRISHPDGRGSVTEAAGGVVRERLVPGRYGIDVQDHVSTEGWSAVDVAAGTRQDLVFTLRATRPHTFTLQHPADGEPLLVSWTWRDRQGRELARDHLERRRNDGDVVELVRHLAPGTYRVELRSHAGFVAEAIVEAPAAAGAAPIALLLQPPDLPIRFSSSKRK